MTLTTRRCRTTRRAAAFAMGALACLAFAPTAAHAVSVQVITEQLQGNNDAVDAFEKANPSVKIDKVNVSILTLGPLTRTQLKANSAPDVLVVGPGAANLFGVVPYAQSGYVQPITGSFTRGLPQAYLDTLSRTSVKSGKRIKTLYAVPVNVSVWGMFFNADMFRKNNWKQPKTFKELLTLCQTIANSNTGARAIAFPAVSNSLTSGVVLETIARSNNLPDNWAAQRTAGKVKFSTTKQWKSALRHIVDMSKANCFQASPQGTTDAAAAALFASGRTAMYGAQSSIYARVKAISPNIDARFAPFPADKASDNSLIYNPSSSFAINAKAKDAAGAKKFVEFMAGPYSSTYSNAIGSIASHDLFDNKLPVWMGASLKGAVRAKRVFPAPDTRWPTPDILTTVKASITGLFTGQSTVSSVLADADKSWDTWVNTYVKK